MVVKNKQQYLNAIEAELSNGTPPSKIARKLYLSYPTFAFIDNEDLEFEIKDAISSKLAIPITSIQVAGSAKIGLSLHKKTDFDPSFSDLDIAIIDNNLFNAYLETAYRNSRGYSDGTKFKNQKTHKMFKAYILKGIINPNCMPVCKERKEWNVFFGKLSTKHSKSFRSINGIIYMSELFFESKQRSVINSYKDITRL